MFGISSKIIAFLETRKLSEISTYFNITFYWSRSYRMTDQWPILDKRKKEIDDGTEIKKLRIKKKMYAILLAYCGQGYLGLQRNAGSKTIEEELMKALRNLEILNDEEFQKQQLVHFQRAARTDKGVSALRQVVNLNMREGVKPEDINQYLPTEIKVLGVKRVTKGFNSKNSCDARTYSYTCPSFAFAPKLIKPIENYRIDNETFEKLNMYSKYYVGTHNFFNFTSGRKPFDPSCNRLIIDTEWKRPVISDGLELIMFLVKGQSFMLHQIRKMVGTLMAICRGHLDSDYINKALNPKECAHLPTAPGLGLLLEKIHYDRYNNKFGDNGFHDKLDFADVEEMVEEFRVKHIHPVLIKAEKEDKSMVNYLETLDSHYEEYNTSESLHGEQIYSTDSSDGVNFIVRHDVKNEHKIEEKCNSNLSSCVSNTSDNVKDGIETRGDFNLDSYVNVALNVADFKFETEERIDSDSMPHPS